MDMFFHCHFYFFRLLRTKFDKHHASASAASSMSVSSTLRSFLSTGPNVSAIKVDNGLAGNSSVKNSATD